MIDGYSSNFSLNNNNTSLLNRLGSGGQSSGQSQMSDMHRGIAYNSMDIARREEKQASMLAGRIAKQREAKEEGVLLSQPAILVNDGDDINIKNNERKL